MPASVSDSAWVPSGIDVNRPNAARIYDYLLGGKNHLPADRVAAEQVLAAAPGLAEVARQNRAFLERAVHYLATEAGIRQFVDLGAGLPTCRNVHEVVRAVTPDARVVYVDNDPIVLAHGRALLAEDSSTVVVAGDIRQPAEILEDVALRSVIDFTRPVGVLFVAVLHFLTAADDPRKVVAAFRRLMVAGSHLVISHGTAAGQVQQVREAARRYAASTRPVTLRDPDEIRLLFNGFELLPPGLVTPAQWRVGSTAGDGAPDVPMLAGVGRRTAPASPLVQVPNARHQSDT